MFYYFKQVVEQKMGDCFETVQCLYVLNVCKLLLAKIMFEGFGLLMDSSSVR